MSETTVGVGGHYPRDPENAAQLQGFLAARNVDRAYPAHFSLSAAEAVVADTNGVHAAVTDTGVAQEITTGFTAPPIARSITATSGGTAGDIKAIQITVEGTDEAGATITETLPVLTVNAAATVEGAKAFKTITKMTIPAHDGTGATTELGFGDKIGLRHKLAHDTVVMTHHNNVLESTASTVAVDATNLSGNTVDLDTALDGSVVDIYYFV